MNWKVLGGGLAITLPLVALLAAGFGRDPKLRSEAVIGKAAPGFDLEQVQGGQFDLEAYRGSPVVVNFWSTWCGPCKYEHPYLLRAARSNPDVRFLGVIYNDEPEKCRRYLSQAGSAYPHLVDDSSRTAIDYGVGGVPETFFINRAGEIVHKQNGPLDNRALSFHLSRIKGLQ